MTDNPFLSIMGEQDRHKLKGLSIALKKKETDLASYRDTLSNLIRRLHDITAVVTKLHRRTDQELRDCAALTTEIRSVLGESPEQNKSAPTP